MQAVILAGGKGTRLAARLAGRPKPLVPVCEVPLLQRQIETLRENGVDRIVVLVNYEGDQIRRFCAENADFGVSLTIIDDGKPRGTAGALLACLASLEERFLIVYGDTLFDIDVARMLAAHDAKRADVTLLLHPNDHPADSDLVSIDSDGRITAFHPYPRASDAILPNLVNAAFYIAEHSAFVRWRDFVVPSDLARDLFPAMVAQQQRLFGYRSFEYIKDLGTPARLDKVEAHMRAGRPGRARLDVPQPCVFVDRDGTINLLRGHISRAENIALIPGAAAAIRQLNDAEIRVAIITNQPVLARGECTPEELTRIHWKLESALGLEGAMVDGIWWCPHHPDVGFPGEVVELKRDCTCRKPAPGLIFEAAAHLNVDLSRSWMIGDTTSDMLAARRAGVGAILVKTGEGGSDGKFSCPPDFIVADLAEAVRLIVEDVPRWTARVKGIATSISPGEAILINTTTNRNEAVALAAMLALTLRQQGLSAETHARDGASQATILVIADPVIASSVAATGRLVRQIDAVNERSAEMLEPRASFDKSALSFQAGFDHDR